jgi:transposase-like protein
METLCFKGNYLKRFARVKEFCNEKAEFVITDFIRQFCDLWLEEEFIVQSGAEPYARTDTRRDKRAGHYGRWLITSYGQMRLRIPRGKDQRYSFTLFERFKRRTKHFEDVVVNSILLGHSSRKASSFFARQFGINTLSHQTAMSTFRKFGGELERWRRRSLRDNAVILVLDAVWLKGAIECVNGAKPVLFAYAIYEDGTEEVLDFDIARGESDAAWTRFCHKIYERGLKNVRLVVRDDCKAIENAVATYWPKALDQLCVFHLMQNVVKRLPRGNGKRAIIKAIQTLYEAEDVEEFRHRVMMFKKRYAAYCGTEAVIYFLNKAGESIRYYGLPRKYWGMARTTNRLERFFEELKRRIKVFRRFPNSGSCERWLYALVMEIKPDSLGNPSSLESQQSS